MAVMLVTQGNDWHCPQATSADARSPPTREDRVRVCGGRRPGGRVVPTTGYE